MIGRRIGAADEFQCFGGKEWTTEMGKLFGTDGIRGKANAYPMTCEMAMKVGRAVAAYFRKDHHPARIVIGRDTRISGAMLEHALVAGICSAGGEALLAGVLPTPGVARLSVEHRADAGVVISASHNPFQDNGIKLFRGDGFKLSDDVESAIETLILENGQEGEGTLSEDVGNALAMAESNDQYVRFLKSTLAPSTDLSGWRLAVDCSHGATCWSAPMLFRELGARVDLVGASPNGRNINDHCGSQHPELLQKRVVESGAKAGLAFDGDGDRLIAVDEKGRVVTGDQILVVCARHLKETDALDHDLAVSTVMSNIGLGLALKRMGVRHLITDVGDRYVLHEMRKTGAVIGGEDSGHMIFLKHHTTGDGLLTALRLLEAMHDLDAPLSELAGAMKVYPQVLLNLDVTRKPDIASVPEIASAIDAAEKELGEEGRVLVRYSGTQPLLRVMVEGPTMETTRRCCETIVDAARSVLG